VYKHFIDIVASPPIGSGGCTFTIEDKDVLEVFESGDYENV
jgi:hypothetical protein